MRKQDYYEPIIGRESEPRRRPKKKKKRANRGERVVVTLLSLLFLTVAIVATVKYVVRAPEPVTDNEDQQTQQDGTAEDSDAIQTISNGKERKKYCYTILAYGVDNDAGGSDTNMLVRFDAENKKIDVVSLPRDTLMSNGRKLNSSYNNGGTEKLRSNIEDMLGVPVDFYVSVDLKGFIALIDQIGGVDFDVPEDMDYDDPYQDLHIHFKAGLQHLSGQQSMEVVRFRHNSDKDNPGYGGRQDIGRIGTQQAFLKTVAQKLMKIENVPAMAETFLKICQDRPDARQPRVARQPGALHGRDGRHQLCHAPRRRRGLVQGQVLLHALSRAGARDDEFDAQPLCRRHHRRRTEHFSPVIPVKF